MPFPAAHYSDIHRRHKRRRLDKPASHSAFCRGKAFLLRQDPVESGGRIFRNIRQNEMARRYRNGNKPVPYRFRNNQMGNLRSAFRNGGRDNLPKHRNHLLCQPQGFRKKPDKKLCFNRCKRPCVCADIFLFRNNKILRYEILAAVLQWDFEYALDNPALWSGQFCRKAGCF